VDDAIAITLERRADPALLLRKVAPAGLERAYGEVRQPAVLLLAYAAFEGIDNRTRAMWHL
jgi:hypothetical protein